MDAAPKLITQKLSDKQFDPASIDGSLPEISRMEMAVITADEDTLTLPLSCRSEINDQSEKFCHLHLRNVPSTENIVLYSKLILAELQENIRLVRESVVQMRASTAALKATVTESQRQRATRRGTTASIPC